MNGSSQIMRSLTSPRSQRLAVDKVVARSPQQQTFDFLPGGGVSSTSQLGAPADASDEAQAVAMKHREALEQQSNDLATAHMQELTATRHQEASEELGKARAVSQSKIQEMQGTLLLAGGGVVADGGNHNRAIVSRDGGGRTPSNTLRARSRNGNTTTTTCIPASPQPYASATPYQLEAPSASSSSRIVDPSLKKGHHVRVELPFLSPTTSARRAAGEAASDLAVLSPLPPGHDSLPSFMGVPGVSLNNDPFRRTVVSPRKHHANLGGPSPSRTNIAVVGAVSVCSATIPTTAGPSASHSADLPVPFRSSNIQSLLKWAELSFEEAIIASRGPANASSSDEPTLCRQPYPDRLLTTACCAIVDELMQQLVPSFRTCWNVMRAELFGAIFQLTPQDIADTSSSSKVGGGDGVTSSMSYTTTNNNNSEQSAIHKLSWFSRVCARRQMWAHAERDATALSKDLKYRLDNVTVSVEKYDRIFDVYERTADRALISRAFNAWATVAIRGHERSLQLQKVFARITAKPPMMTAFYAWRRIVLERKFKSSKDRDQSLSAMQEAKLRNKANELEYLQKQLEAETQRMRAQSEKDSRAQAALVTSHAVELRELQSVQDAKDEVILSLEKIAKRWERLAKSFRPHMLRPSPPSAVIRAAFTLQQAELDMAMRGPNASRLSTAKEQLDGLLSLWVNSILDAIGSRATRIKNCTSDIRDGEALMDICKHIISRHSGVSGSGRGSSSALIPNRSASFNNTAVREGTTSGSSPSLPLLASMSLHDVVCKALYTGTSHGLRMPLIATCPFVLRILAREQFFESPHPTAGLWIVASLFVNEMLNTSFDTFDNNNVAVGRGRSASAAGGGGETTTSRFGCLGEHQVALAFEHCLMIPDRSVAEPYPVRRKDSMKALMLTKTAVTGLRTATSQVGMDGRRNSSKREMDRATRSATFDDDEDGGLVDTASDIDAYLGDGVAAVDESDVGDSRSSPSSMFGVDGVAHSSSSSSSDDDTADSEILATTATRLPVAPPPPSGGNFMVAVASEGQGKNTVTSPVEANASSHRFSVINRDSTGSPTSRDVSAEVPDTIRVPSLRRPSAPTSSGETSRASLLAAAAAAAEIAPPPSASRGVLPPVRKDLATLPMHMLVRRLRREEKNSESWIGLARLVTSVVLRFRVLDVDAPVKGRQPQAFSTDGPQPMEPSRTPSFMSNSRTSSFVGSVPRDAPATTTAPPAPSNIVPRTSVGGVPRRQSAAGPGRTNSGHRRGSGFFQSESLSPAPVPQQPTSANAGRRSTLVRFEQHH